MKYVLTAVIVVATLLVTSTLSAAPPSPALSTPVPANPDHGVYTVPPGMPASTPSLVSLKKVRVPYVNSFRFDLGPQTTQTPIGAAALPGALGAGSSDIAKLPTAIAQPQAIVQSDAGARVGEKAVAPPPPEPAAFIPTYPEACDQSDTLHAWPTGTSSQNKLDRIRRITVCWNGTRDAIEAQRVNLTTLRTRINQSIRAENEEQRCYTQMLWTFRQPLLTANQAYQLIALANANATVAPASAGGCRRISTDDWPLDQADTIGVSLLKLQQDPVNLTTAPGYADWVATTPNSANQTANAALVKQVGDFIAEANSYSTGTATSGAGSVIAQTYNDYQAVVANNMQWRSQLSNLLLPSSALSITSPPLELDVAIDDCKLWYGKGRTDVVKLHAVDLSTSAGASQDITLATNTCNPLTIASSGVGVSFLASPTYAFVASDNTGTQVIGQTAVNKQSPLYAVLYNVQLANLGRGVELFASPGVGLTSASNTTTSDFLAGLSLSFARRVLFVTPSADFGRRDELTPGFKIGTPKGSLTSVPTQSHWPVGFMVSISFGIGPS